MKQLRKLSAYLFVLLFYFILSINTPLTGDDWTWKSIRGMQRLWKFFDNYNGRYLSNIIEIGLVRSDILRYITLALISFGIVYLINQIAAKRPNTLTFLLTFTLFMLMPIKIFSQTLGWTAGYVNYVISIFLLLVYFYYDKSFKQYESKLSIVLIFLLAVATQLLVEHVTLYVLFAAAVICVKDKLVRNKIYYSSISYLAGAVIGAAIMFQNGAYMRIINKEDTYRTVGSDRGLFLNMLEIYSNQIQKFLFIENYTITLILSVFCLIILHKKKNVMNAIAGSVIFGYVLFLTLFKTYVDEHHYPDIMVILSSILTLTYIISLFIVLYSQIQSEKSERSYALLFYGISAVILTAPFLVLTPYGGRGAFATYVFIVMAIVQVSDMYINLTKNRYMNYAVIAAVGIALFYIIPIMQNGSADRERLEIIENTNFTNKESIVLPGIPNKQFHQMPDPAENVYMTQFYKKVYGIPDEVKIVIQETDE